MATSMTHSRPRRARSSAATTAAPAPRIHERPVGVALTGLTALVVGAWGALAGYIGPYFDFRPVAHDAWAGTWTNGMLHLLPGAVAAAAGLMLIAMGPARRSIRGGAFVLPAILLLAAGAWFVIGPVAWPTFHSGAPFMTGTTATRNLLNVAGASYAPGLVLVMLGGMALKAGMVPAVPVEDPYTPAEAVAPARDTQVIDDTEGARAARRTADTTDTGTGYSTPDRAGATDNAGATDSARATDSAGAPTAGERVLADRQAGTAATTGTSDVNGSAATTGTSDTGGTARTGFWSRRR